MDFEEKPTKYLKLKEFLARNPCVEPRTFTRWKRRRLIDFIQPGGPNTKIYVPEDALERMQKRAKQLRGERGAESSGRKAVEEANAQDVQTEKPKPVRQPNWKKRIKRKRKDDNAKEE